LRKEEFGRKEVSRGRRYEADRGGKKDLRITGGRALKRQLKGGQNGLNYRPVVNPPNKGDRGV